VIPAANFEFESRVTEAVLLGNISLRSGEMVRWDSGNMKITNALRPSRSSFPIIAGMEGVLRVIGKVGVNLVPLSQSACPRGHL